MGRRNGKLKKTVFLLFICAAVSPLLCGCVTGKESAGGIVEIQAGRSLKNRTFYILKGNTESYLNNLMFQKYSGFVRKGFEENGFEETSYGEADMYLVLEYGIQVYSMVTHRWEREYDRKTGVTTWIHQDESTQDMAFISLTAIDGNPYRNLDEKVVLWQLTVRDSEYDPDAADLFLPLIRTAYPRLGRR